MFLVSRSGAQEFPIGIWFDGNRNAINDVKSMGFTWLTAYGGMNLTDSPNYNHILQNNRNLKVLAALERNSRDPSFVQRMEY